jgi:hypothetical protein
MAMAELPAEDLPHDEVERTVHDFFHWWNADNLKVMLSIAEAFRLRGESHKALGAHEALLPQGTAFTCPPMLGIKPSSLTLTKPEEWLISEIGGGGH